MSSTVKDEQFNATFDIMCQMGPAYQLAATIILMQTYEFPITLATFNGKGITDKVMAEAEEIIAQYDASNTQIRSDSEL